ncbi:hypothetical protein ACSBR1_028536 [Camellia fascicularis]
MTRFPLASRGLYSNTLKAFLLLPIHPTILESILVISFTIATILIIVPCESIDGSPVPTIIFKGLPSIFHCFVVSVLFSFTGSLSALLIHDDSSLVRFCGFTSMVSMISALAILIWAGLTSQVY